MTGAGLIFVVMAGVMMAGGVGLFVVGVLLSLFNGGRTTYLALMTSGIMLFIAATPIVAKRGAIVLARD